MTKLSSKLERIESKLKTLGPQGHLVYNRYSKIDNKKERYARYKKAYPILKEELLLRAKYKEIPVPIEEFIRSPDYINHSDIIYAINIRQ